MKKSKLIFFVGSSCSGKTTAEEHLLKANKAKRLLTCTTRDIRPGESNGIHYNFLSVDDFHKENCQNIITITDEWFYGVQPAEIVKAANSDIPVIYSLINMEFAANMIDYLEKSKEMEYVLVYFNIDTETRTALMRSRGESEEDIEKRLSREDKPCDLIKWKLEPDIVVTELTDTLAEDLWVKVLAKVG